MAWGPGAGWAKGHGAEVLGWVRCLEGRGGLLLPPLHTRVNSWEAPCVPVWVIQTHLPLGRSASDGEGFFPLL